MFIVVCLFLFFVGKGDNFLQVTSKINFQIIFFRIDEKFKIITFQTEVNVMKSKKTFLFFSKHKKWIKWKNLNTTRKPEIKFLLSCLKFWENLSPHKTKIDFFGRSDAEGRAELAIGLAKKKVNKKKRYDDDHQFCTWSNYSLSCRSFYPSLPLSTFKNFFLCFPLLQSIQKTFWETIFE